MTLVHMPGALAAAVVGYTVVVGYPVCGFFTVSCSISSHDLVLPSRNSDIHTLCSKY